MTLQHGLQFNNRRAHNDRGARRTYRYVSELRSVACFLSSDSTANFFVNIIVILTPSQYLVRIVYEWNMIKEYCEAS